MSHHHDILGAQESVFQELEGKIITLEGFHDNGTITGEVSKATYDHIAMTVSRGEFSGAEIKVDLHVLGDAKPKVKRIIYGGNVIELFDNDEVPNEFAILSAETEVKKQVIQLIKYYEDGFFKLEEIEAEIDKMNLSIEMLRLIRGANHAIIGILIGNKQDAL